MTDDVSRAAGPEDASPAHAPDFDLPDDQGKPIRLSELYDAHSVVLYFARSFG